jgi:hypothetical protein
MGHLEGIDAWYRCAIYYYCLLSKFITFSYVHFGAGAWGSEHVVYRGNAKSKRHTMFHACAL